jgi:hypothetical protein
VPGKSKGVTPEQLANRYPKLYHMAADGAWPNIRKLGLLSTSRLLDLFDICGEQRADLEESRRPKSVLIESKKYGSATIRDQKPMSEKRLDKCLEGCTRRQWMLLLNSRVFFWLDLDRLKTLMCAREYEGRYHTVLTIDTASLVDNYSDEVTLCHLNSGCTSPYAFARGPHSFRHMSDYPFAERRSRGLYGQVAELAVLGGVPDIEKYVIQAARARCSKRRLTKTSILYERP